MGKIKTKRTLTKRVRITRTGKVLKKHNRAGHLKAKWSANMKNRKKGLETQSNKGHIKMFKKLLGR